MTIFNWIIVGCWAVFILYWGASAIGKKKVVRRTGSWWQMIFTILVMTVIIVLFAKLHLSVDAIPQTMAIGVIACILCVGGVAIAIWARWHLGKNWNSAPSIQEGHELVTSGPYRFIRHPIYTGVIMAILGSSLIEGAFWIIVFVLACAMFVWRIDVEEKLMEEIFPEDYAQYKQRTKALIPFVW